MANFRCKYSKSKDQQFVTIRKSGGDSIASATSLTATVYKDDFTTAHNTYILTAEELSLLKTRGYVTVRMSDLIGAGSPDAYYSVVLNQGTTFVSAVGGFGLTIEATAKVYGKQGFINVYSPDYRVDEVLHTAHMLLSEMNAIEDIEIAYQKREDFELRLAMLKNILRY